MTEELISVIVPVYNVAAYLDRCVGSIVNQTYKNLEILLVDDGSTDASGELCDAWAERDGRVRVLHKPNGGQSEARNMGIERATGDYIGFADADDWLDTSMLETLYAAIRNHPGADMAVCGFAMAYGDEIKESPCSGESYTLTGGEAVQGVAHSRWPVSTASVCNKLYRRRLWESIRFPVGTYFEDAYVRSRIYARCERVAVVDRNLYFYYQREDSTMHALKLTTQMDGVNILLQECEFICGQYPHLRPAASGKVLSAIWNVYVLKLEGKDSIPPEMDRYLKALFRQYRRGARKYLHPRQQLIYALFSISPSFMCTVLRPVWRVYKKLHPL